MSLSHAYNLAAYVRNFMEAEVASCLTALMYSWTSTVEVRIVRTYVCMYVCVCCTIYIGIRMYNIFFFLLDQKSARLIFMHRDSK